MEELKGKPQRITETTFYKNYESYKRKRKTLTAFDVEFLLQELIDEDKITFRGNNGKLEKNKYDIHIYSYGDFDSKQKLLHNNDIYNFQIRFNLKNEKDIYNGDEVINRLKKYI